MWIRGRILSFEEARKALMALKVLNDSAERGIALASTFNSSITKQEEQKQYLYQVVEHHRKQFPNTKKFTPFAERTKKKTKVCNFQFSEFNLI